MTTVVRRRRRAGARVPEALGLHRSPTSLVALALCLAGFGLWGASLGSIPTSGLGDYGLPPALPPIWYLALAIGVLGSAVAALSDRRAVFAAFLALTIAVLFATVPALSEAPQYTWTYKHLGVVRHIEATGSVDPRIDIYNRWPGFFAAMAVLARLAGAPNPVSFAGWAEPFFAVLEATLVFLVLTVASRDRRIGALGALLFTVTNWVGQNYFSPQALGFVLSLAALLLILRFLSDSRSGVTGRLERLMGRIGGARQLAPEPPLETPTRAGRRAVVAAVLLIHAAIVIAHQLTPYLLTLTVALLVLVGVTRPRWLVLAMAVMVAGMLAVNYTYITRNYGLFSGLNPFSNAQHSTLYDTSPLPGKVFSAMAGRAVLLTLWLLAAASAFVLVRRGLGRRALPLMVLAATPFALVFSQDYGGEAALRVGLFTAPWCAGLVAWAIVTTRRPAVRTLAATAAAVAATTAFVPAFLGQAELNIVPRETERASDYFYAHARRGSVLLLSSPGFPIRYGSAYPQFVGPEGDEDPNLLRLNSFRYRPLGAAQVPVVESIMRQYARHGYVVFSELSYRFAEVYRLSPPDGLRGLERAIAASPRFRLFYGSKAVRIYERVGR